MKILVLGGTAEARVLAGKLADRKDIDVTLSLAGRTAKPRAQGVPTRIGGFGGVQGLTAYLRDERVDALIDATHPYADTISANAVRAADQAGVPVLALRRAPWERTPGDQWIEVGSVPEAVAALGAVTRRVFLALGRNEIDGFAMAPQHTYLVRSVDPVDPPLSVPHAIYLTARGPFSEAVDRALLERHRIDVIVAKNSGGDASYGKIAAARALHLPVVMLERPAMADTASVETVEEVFAWLDHAVTLAATRGV
ncbi:cobalt-precorrin-6A reductase [Methyloceanibacter marginalis]|jgi:precorrin-6A/cobalt-precorrin-6A reductase|uniref:Cobalt-precorrin-6A reductase n=1 Tax=Methyloceanibacter marginalis TaxID=1774971 RepID=A0A1E3W5R8_9HYPH|nr:cobalt-precorrin-6A reductase [Methyloceanibacter marginalis]ODS00842.1 cobalt-precorrin-6A reductase [Methyloceanibacter marginalis]